MEDHLHVEGAEYAHPGKSASVTLSLKAESVEPSQPLLVQMGARAPDFRQDLSINYPSPAQASKTYTIPLSAGYKDYKDPWSSSASSVRR